MEKRIFGENVHLYFIKLNGNAGAASIVAALFSLMNYNVRFDCIEYMIPSSVNLVTHASL
jgi:hypothetical protein